MRKLKSRIAMLLVLMIVFISVPIEGMTLENTSEPQVVEKIDTESLVEDSIDSTENIEGETETETVAIEDESENVAEELSTEEKENETELVSDEKNENGEVNEDCSETESSQIQETEESVTGQQRYLIQYLIMNQNTISLQETLQIAIGIECESTLSGATLQYHNAETGESYSQECTEILDNVLVFDIGFFEINMSGMYVLDEISFMVDEVEYTEIFSEAGIEAYFGMNQEVDNTPDAYIEEEVDIESNVVRIDEDGNTISENSLQDALNEVKSTGISAYGLDDSDIVVVLDPGHDNTHAGAQANGLGEEDINIKIAAYCKEELEQYQGIKVYLTRGLDGACPYPGTTSSQCNEKRVEFAQSVNADIFVSLHNNSAANTAAHGAMVFYPNANYNPWVNQVGQDIAELIQEQLVALGLYDRGIQIKNADNTTYPDGTKADYYSIIRRCKLVGIPAVIVEHAFLTNVGDVNEFLSSDGRLKELGVADATAIASYYGLSKSVSISVGSINVTDINHTQGNANILVNNVQPFEKISKLSVAMWSTSNQSDLYWYNIVSDGTGNYSTVLDISNHNYNYGRYYVDVYAHDIYGNSHYVGGTTCTFLKPKTSITATADAKQNSYDVEVNGLTGNYSEVKIAVWSKNGGQDDLRWYSATKKAAGRYKANIPIINHKSLGLYYADVYAVRGSIKTYVGGTTFDVSKTTISAISIKNISNETGTFDVELEGITAISGITKVQVPVWSKKDQSDIYWYTAEKQTNGKYIVHVNIANHKYNYGNYYVDVYATSGNGIRQYLGGKTATISIPKVTTSAIRNSEQEMSYLLKTTDANIVGGVKGLRFAVWSKNGGQDDLKWYSASNSLTGAWTAEVLIANHKTVGLYYVDTYATNASGNSIYLGGTTFEVKKASVSSIEIQNKSDGAGTFQVRIAGITSVSGINKVQVPVWSKKNHSDIYWYTAEKQADGSFLVNVNIANHKYNYGTYYADVYLTAGNGVYQYMGGRTVTVSIPKTTISASENTTQSVYTVTASNVGMAGGVKNARIAVWSKNGGQDDLIWYPASNILPGVWSISVPIKNHKTAGTYYADTYVTNAQGNSVYIGGTTFEVKAPKASAVNLINYNEADGTFGVQVSGVQSMIGIERVRVAVWSAGNQSDLVWYNATETGAGQYQIGADIRNHQNNTGKYYADVYIQDKNGIQAYVGGVTCSLVNVTNVLHPLMGSNSVTVAQMVKYYNSKASYPSFYKNTDAPTIEAFCRLYLEECQAEGVKAEVAFCQAMKETGFLKFGGNVSITQFNFAGLGSTGPGVAGESFPNVRIGIRAQVQHLKAYGCATPLNQMCVDNRFKYVTRNSAPYVEWLGIQENPYGKGWATGKNYGYSIVNMVNALKMY